MPIIKPVKDGRFFIKWFHARYLEKIASLECESCEAMWSRKDILNQMYCEHSNGYVITDLEKPVGFIVCESKPNHDLNTILNLVIDPDYRNQGLGKLLLKRVFTVSSLGLDAFVRASNLGAQLFFQKMGFICKDTYPGYFVDVNGDEKEYEDAYRFVWQKR